MEINSFRGDLADISFKKEPLHCVCNEIIGAGTV